uniref:Secreted protein n=1 Tax=Neovison vison TaxID=452646 RepID=A0A8C7BVH2_NEOVI
MAFSCLCIFSLLSMHFTNMARPTGYVCPMMPQIHDNRGIPTCVDVNNSYEVVCSFCVICFNDTKGKQIYST